MGEEKTIWSFLKKLNIELPYDPAIPLLGIYPKQFKIGTQTNPCTCMFTAALFTIAERWMQPKCPSMDEWINKMWSIHTAEYYSALKRKEILTHVTTWMNFEDIMLNEKSQPHTHPEHCTIPLTKHT